MDYLKEIFVIITSSLIGASISAIITILMNRKDSTWYGKLLYRCRIWGLVLLELLAFLWLILSF
jgi:hypothetical protein